MEEVKCPQCEKLPTNATYRLVQDACGHRKCRMCLLQDEDSCRQCRQNSDKQQSSVITKRECDTLIVSNRETAGNRRPSEEALIDELSTVSLKTAGNGKTAKKAEVAAMKRSYQTIVIPNHISVLKDPVSYKCNVCNKVFVTKSHIKYHMYCEGGNKPYRCNVCNKEYITKSHLEIHTYVHAGTKPYSCTICGKSFTLRSKLNRHKMLHGTTRPYVCQQCGKSFRSKESLKIHNFVHSGEKPYKCGQCSARFNNSSNLNKHLVTHTKDKVHMCDQCGKRFKLKWALTVHKRSHLKIRPFECANCLKTFVNAKDLSRHKLIHIDMKAYSCGICEVGFRRKDNLERHMRNSHPGKTAKAIKNLEVKASPVDTPNAIKVITPNTNKKAETKITPPPFMNVPLKLAFKTSAFKNHYNIHRDYIEPPKIHPKPYDLEESVNICQRILSPHSPPPPRNVIKTLGTVDEKVSTEICQKILAPFSAPPLHYETSFEHKKHALIKNIKFKLPPNYTNIKTSEIAPLKPVPNVNLNEERLENGTYAELKTINVSNGATSVIVKGSASQSDVHWRRRTLQNHLQTKQ